MLNLWVVKIKAEPEKSSWGLTTWRPFLGRVSGWNYWSGSSEAPESRFKVTYSTVEVEETPSNTGKERKWRKVGWDRTYTQDVGKYEKRYTQTHAEPPSEIGEAIQAQEPRTKNFLGWKKWSSIKECHRKVREDKETRTKEFKVKVIGMTLSVSGIRRKSVKWRMGGVRFRFYKKPQILHRETQFSGILEGYG